MQRLLLIVGASVALASEVTPVQKVLQLLANMKEKGEKELKEEQIQFAKFSQFCDATLVEKQVAIDKNTDTMEMEEAEIANAKSEVKRLANEIQLHTDGAAKSKAKQDEATEIRNTERSDFQTTLTDYTESIDAIGRALKALKDDAAKKVSLLQLAKVRRFLPKESLGEMDAYLSTIGQEQNTDAETPKLGSLLEESAVADDAQVPRRKTYESQTGGVVKMLESLQDKFVDERNELETEEASKKHAYELLMQKLKALEAQNKKDKQEKTGFKAKQEQKQAAAEGDFEDAAQERDSDKAYHDDLKATCAKKSSDFEERQTLRKEELEALTKAQDIISSGTVAGSADTHLPSLLQKSSALAFLRSEAQSPAQDEVAQFLQNAANKLGSRMLSAAAVRAGADPIAKVKKMVEDLILKLNQQNKAEADKEAWCDTELATNKATREDKTETTEALQSEMDGLKASIAKLGEETNVLSKEISELNIAMKEATELRQKEKKKNEATMKDAKEAQTAVAKAIQVLNKFYTKAGEATSFVQKTYTAHSEQPEIFGDTPYKGMGAEGGGVVGILEVIESDFARLLAETTAAEDASGKEYNSFMLDSKQDKATKEAALTHKKDKSTEQAEELENTDADFIGTSKELDAAMEYYSKLKSDCLDTGKSYSERKAQREEEVADLKEALEMLEKV
mmetsp:Transcript_19181/g.33784  ORF Transcript_19181/g.33784 Transcript_19181/m.33784 type:complete len:680 (+) Transcript_19181:71-2110(+)